MIEKNSGLILTYIISVASCVLGLILGLAWPVLITAEILLILSLRLPKVFDKSILVRSFVVIILTLSFIQVLGVLFHIVNIDVNPAAYSVTILLLALALIAARYKKYGSMTYGNKLEFDKIDLIVFLPALLFSGMLFARLLYPPNNIDSSFIGSIGYGTDDATHMSFYKDLILSNGNFDFTSKNSSALIQGDFPDNSTKRGSALLPGDYPMGWHLSGAVISSSFHNYKTTPVLDIVKSYYFIKLFSIFICIASIGIFISELYKKIRLSMKSVFDKLGFLLINFFAAFVFILPLYFQGFLSFLPVIAFLLLFATTYLDKDNESASIATYVSLALLTIASSLTWLLTAPILILALGVKIISDYKLLRKIPASVYALYAASIVFMILQIISLLTIRSDISQLSAEGGILITPDILLVIVMSIYVYTHSNKHPDFNLSRDLAPLTVSSALVLLSVLAFISIKSRTITYYYYKVQIIVLILLVSIVGVYIINLVYKNKKTIQEKMLAFLLVAIVFGLSIPALVGYGTIVYNGVAIKHYNLPDPDRKLIVSQALSRTYSSTNTKILYFYFDEPAELTTRESVISRVSFRPSDCDYYIYDATFKLDAAYLRQQILRCDETEIPTIVNTNAKGNAILTKTLTPDILEKYHITINSYR